LRAENRFLQALSGESIRRLQPHLRPISLKNGDRLYGPDEPSPWVYFPRQPGLVSLVATTAQGDSVEVALVGREGVVGIWSVFDAPGPNHEALVQNSGEAWRAPVKMLRDLADKDAELRSLAMRIGHLIFTQVIQTALCNRIHSAEQRMARWLLVSRDRVESDELHMTHELLGKMLGTRRTTVSLTASMFQQAGIISYKRGQMKIKNRKALIDLSCDCYQVVKKATDKLYR
jgi:CRP-like cAMP-binding protein